MNLTNIIRGTIFTGMGFLSSLYISDNVLSPPKQITPVVEAKEEERERVGLEEIQESFSVLMPYIDHIETAIERNKDIYPVDPLLIAAIVKVESSSNAHAVSWVGAAGLFQIMPETAKEYGFNVHITDDFKNGWKEWRQYIRQNSIAERYFHQNNFERARRMEISSDEHHRKATRFFDRYKKDLLNKIKGKSQEEILEIDQRFHIPFAIDFCIETMAKNLRASNGDLRVAIAAYNAGLGAVRKYKGIPTYSQTVIYQNKVMNAYNKLKKLER